MLDDVGELPSIRVRVWCHPRDLRRVDPRMGGKAEGGNQRPQSLRIVRHLPVRAQLSELVELDGQVLDNP